MKILMVCLGNICRSPLAEGILKHKALQQGLHWEVGSAGTAGYHVGEPPHRLSIKVAKQNGIDISRQCCSRFIKEDIFYYDKIFVMDDENYAEVKRICGSSFNENKVDLLLNMIEHHANKNVPDPWYGNEDGYHTVFAMIDAACEMIVKTYANKSQLA